MSSTQKKPLLGLVMMVRDEADTIRESILSCLPAVDCVVLVDTGSSDDTVDKAIDACSENDIPLHLYRERFIDFGRTRTTSLKLAAPHAEWLLMLSGGETVQEAERTRTYLECINIGDAFNVEVDFGAITYRHPRVTRSDSPWYYKGSTHEALVHPDGMSVSFTIPGTKIIHASDKNPERRRRRWEKDEDLLTRELEDDPDNARAQFYYAQTLECLGRAGAAARFYQKRADNKNGYQPEAYEALLRLARIEPRNAIEHLTRAVGMYPNWPDAPTLIADQYQASKNHGAVFVWARRACELGFNPSTLFSRKHLDQLRWDLLSSSAFYCQQPQLGRRGALHALGNPKTDERIRRTFKFYSTQEHMPGTCVLVTGMGRSGTSLVARIIENLGVDMGPSIDPDETNPDGFCEDKYVLGLLTEGDLHGLSGYLAARVENAGSIVGCKAPRLADHWPQVCATLPKFNRLVVINVTRKLDAAASSYVRCYGGDLETARTFLAKREEAMAEGKHQGDVPWNYWRDVSYEDLCANPSDVVGNLAHMILPRFSGNLINEAAKLVRSDS